MKISIIGAGNMGSAIACGLAGKEVFKGNITVSDASLPKLEELQKGLPGISICRDNVEACKCADVIILAVKPFMIKNVIEEIRDSLDCKRQIIVSIAAGIGLKALEEFFSGTDGRTPAIFHIIPNTAVKVGAGMSFITYSNADEEAKEKVLGIFGNLGETMVVDEKLLDAGMALSSCGIAYIFRYIRAAVEAGVELGFRPAEAQRIISQTMNGAVILLEKSGGHPEQEIDKVTTAGGLTIKGLNTMEESGFSAAVIKGIKASVKGN